MTAEPIGAVAGGDEEGISLFQDLLAAEIFQLQDALQQEDGMEAVAAGEKVDAAVQRHMVDGEIFAGGQLAHRIFREEALRRRQNETRRGRKVQHFQRAVDLEFPGIPVAIQPSVVVDAVRRVGVLLDFRQRDAGAYRVQRAGFDQENVAGTGRNAVADLEDRAVFDALAQFHLRDVAVYAVNHRRPRLRVHYVPKLRLAVLVFFPERALVVGMDLDREILRRVDQLDQQREVCDPRRMGAGDAVALHGDIAGNFHARRRAVGDDAAPVLSAGQFPAFRHGRQIGFFMKLLFELRSAPKVILQRRNQLQRIQQDTPLPVSSL